VDSEGTVILRGFPRMLLAQQEQCPEGLRVLIRLEPEPMSSAYQADPAGPALAKFSAKGAASPNALIDQRLQFCPFERYVQKNPPPGGVGGCDLRSIAAAPVAPHALRPRTCGNRPEQYPQKTSRFIGLLPA